MSKTIKFSIKQDGTVTEEVTGAVSNECEQLTKLIEDRLGNVTHRLHKPEYYQQVTEDELLEVMLHLSGYIGVPSTRGAMLVAKRVFAELKEGEQS